MWKILFFSKDYNIEEILKNHTNGESVLEDLDKGMMSSDSNRRKLVDIIVAFIVEKCGRDL